MGLESILYYFHFGVVNILLVTGIMFSRVWFMFFNALVAAAVDDDNSNEIYGYG